MQQLKNLLQKNNIQIAVAESCTGGLFASQLTRLPGSSAWFDRGFITYSNLAKQQMLGVPEALIMQYGAVSVEVAQAMVKGALEHSIADIAVSITGIAGPEGGSLEKPVGTVCFGLAMRNQGIQVEQQQFGAVGRTKIRQLACQYAIQFIISRLSLFDRK